MLPMRMIGTLVYDMGLLAFIQRTEFRIHEAISLLRFAESQIVGIAKWAYYDVQVLAGRLYVI